MTSVNLVSPEDNGHLYSVRFREPLVIEANSKVNMNFAKFKRNGNLFFSNDQTITLEILGCIPSLKPVAPFASNLTLDDLGDGAGVLKIPKINPDTGKAGYSVLELDTRIKTLFDAYQLRDTNKPTQFFHYEGIEVDMLNKNLIRCGYSQQTPQNLMKDITLSTADVKGGGADADNAYTKTSADPDNLYYDNYALSKEHYNFMYNSPYGAGSDRNLIHFRCNRPIDTLENGVSIGLYSKEIADSTWTDATASNTTALTKGTGATNNSANGTAMTNPMIFAANVATQTANAGVAVAGSVNHVLGSYMTFEITGSAGANPNKLSIYFKKKDAGDTKYFNDMGDDFEGMTRVFTESLTAIGIPNDANCEFAIETYWIKGNGTARVNTGRTDSMYIRVYNMVGYTNHTEDNLVWDSRSLGRKVGAIEANWFTNYSGGISGNDAMTGDNTVKASKINASLPFNLIMSAQKQGEGFEFVRMAGFNKDDDNANPANPHTFIQRYKMTFSEELANYLGESESINGINPNNSNVNVDSVSREEAEIVRDSSYSIYLKNLPIKCYKNIQQKFQNGNNNSVGFVVPILYDVPTPFADSQIVNMGDGDIIVGTYQPSINKVLDLDNNKMIINNLDVEIRDTITNELSKELSGSVINFTITKPN
tara:strand:+ start:2077 stop:4029 length:1953 start_codon:yes stop_codon:yes gene_type:complete